MNQINKIAKKICLSFLNTRDELQQKYLNYAKQKADLLDGFFKNNLLKQNIIFTFIYINPFECIKSAQDKTIKVGIILFYVDKINKKDYIPGLMNEKYNSGMGQALNHNNKDYIVVYGVSNKNDYCSSKKYFKQTVTHELMHILDRYIDKEFDSENYFGHNIPDIKENNGIPYPGMFGNDDDIFDEKFAEYFTCKGEQKQYVYDLLQSIQDYAKKTNQKEINVVEQIKRGLQNKNIYFNLVDEFEKKDINYAPLAFLYHLTFSKQKNGTKNTALNILNNLY